MEYLLILKVISWPILFALFARTAKKVDDEAEQIWKYQLYSLATNFRLLKKSFEIFLVYAHFCHPL